MRRANSRYRSLVAAMLVAASGYGQERPAIGEMSPEQLQSLDLEDILQIPIATGTLTGSTLERVPASITTITAAQIRITPARDLNDILEVYVPGLNVIRNVSGPMLGLRGLIGDRNTKILLLVNGRFMNERGHAGALPELSNWDLNDIERVEVLRGPGGVTYGPGAVEMVINIVTKTAADVKQTTLRARAVSPYNALGASLEGSAVSDEAEAYLFASIMHVGGFAPKAFRMDEDGSYGYAGTLPNSQWLRYNVIDYYADFDGNPQLKLDADIVLLKELELFARYTQASPQAGAASSQLPVQIGLNADGSPLFSAPQNVPGLFDRHFTTGIDNAHAFSHDFTLRSTISWSDYDTWGRQGYNGGATDQIHFVPVVYDATLPEVVREQVANIDSSRYARWHFSEQELFAQVLGKYSFLEKDTAALGASYANTYFTSPWGMRPQDMVLGDRRLILSDPNTYIIPGPATAFGVNPAKAIFVGDGFTVPTYSTFGEASFVLPRFFSVDLAARLDKTPYTTLLFTPRAALVATLGSSHVIKAIAQQAERMNTYGQQRQQGSANPNTEMSREAELNYTFLPVPWFRFYAAGYYSRTTLVGFNVELVQTITSGTLDVAGGELELAYTRGKWSVGANQSYAKQVSFTLAPGQADNIITAADQTRPLAPGVILHGYGNDLLNWPNSYTKLFADYSPLSWIHVHADGRVNWGQKGDQDTLSALQLAVAGTQYQDLAYAGLAFIRGKNAYGIDARLDAAVRADFTPTLSATLYCQNLVGTNGNKAYQFNPGNFVPYPARENWVEEPRTFGAMLEWAPQ